jgi:alkylation response protein AidB-like acyl-CoA dehydrogenase
MMRLHHSDSAERFRRDFVAWLDSNLPDPAVTIERPKSSGHLPTWARAWQQRLFDAGYLVPGWPRELGGRNATAVEQMVYFEELARRRIARSFNMQGVSIVAPSVIDEGTTRQREAYAIPLLRGELTACLGMSEPGAGSDLAGLSTRAEIRDDVFVVNGQKVWTSGASHADFCLCFVRTDPAAPKHRGISVLLIDMDTPGIIVRPLSNITGRDQADFNEVFFDDVSVPTANLVGELNNGWRIANASLTHERGMLWIYQSANLERTLDTVLDLASRSGDERLSLGADTVSDQLSRLFIDSMALKLMGYRGFAQVTCGRPAPLHTILKLFGSEALRELNLVLMEALGPAALDVSRDPEEPCALDMAGGRGAWSTRYFSSFGMTISGGSSEIQRNIIAERVLALPRG